MTARGYLPVDQTYWPDGTPRREFPRDGCICQTCAERGVECVRVADPGEDECRPCRRGLHRTGLVVSEVPRPMTAATKGPKTARRTNTGRLYTIDGRQYWSVTTIIGNGLPKPAIAGWQAKTIAEYAVANHRQIAGMLSAVRIVTDNKKPDKPIQVVTDPDAVKAAVDWLKGAPWRESTRKMDLGSAVHVEAEAYVLGKPRPKPLPLVAPYIESFEHFLEDFAPTYYQTPSSYLMTEATVYSPKEVYAGTLDAIVEIGGHPILLDYKAGAGIYPDVALQLAAYANAEFVLLPDGTSEPMPKVTGAAALHLQPYDPDMPEVRGYELIPVDIGPKVFASFKYVREVMRFQEEIAKNVLSQPVTNPEAIAFLYQPDAAVAS